MKCDWPLTSLSKLTYIKHGYAFKGEYFTDTKTDNILLTPGNFEIGGGFKSDKLKYYDGPIPEEYVLNSNDLIVTMTDLSKTADTLGYSALVPYTPNIKYLHNQRIGLVQIKEFDKIDKIFLYFLLRTKNYRHHVVSTATGSTVKHTSPNKILNFSFNLPPLKVQKAAGNQLFKLEQLINNNKRINNTLETIARTIFKSWFVDFDPVQAKAKAIREGRDPELAAMAVIAGKSEVEISKLKDKNSKLASELLSFDNLRTASLLFPSEFADSKFGKIPKGWKFSTIGEEVTIAGGGTPSTKNPNYWDGGKNYWVTPKDLSNLENKILINTSRKITDLGVSKISSGQLPVGSVLMSSRAPVGYLAITQIPVSINQGFIAMICNKFLPSSYIVQWANVNINTIKQHASGSTFAEISKANFKPLTIIVPNLSLIERYNNLVSLLYGAITVNLKQKYKLETIRDNLLPKLISGEIKLNTNFEKI